MSPVSPVSPLHLARMYADAQARVLVLVEPLSEAGLAVRVPGTPRWTVAQLVAHLTGCAADLVNGVVEGAATEPWTSRQVSERSDRAFADVVAEWRAQTPAMVEALATPGRIDAAAFDILTHEHDLRGALGQEGTLDLRAVQAVTGRVTGRVSHMVAAQGLPGLRLVNDDGEWVCGGDAEEVAVTGVAPTMEWFRALLGRRSADQILTYKWEGDPTPYFGILNLFGPLPEADVAEAGAPVPPG